MPYNIFKSKGKKLYLYNVKQRYMKGNYTGGYIIANTSKSARRKAQIAINESNIDGKPVKIRLVKSPIKIGNKRFNV